ncbi:MMPL family transporter [Nocardia sp. NBC_01499]|uniref:MMPL family transporter n=1 Tax=Nocardia sp. NBC_01499 TaxID=2903597 RepID=UPI00386A72D4
MRRRRGVLIGAVLAAVLFAALGAGTATRLLAGGFVAPDAESSRATRFLSDHFGTAQPNLVLTVTAADTVDSPQARAAGDSLVSLLTARGDVGDIQSYWTASMALRTALHGKDGKTALVLGHIAGDETRIQKAAKEISDSVPRFAGVTVAVGGYAATLHDVNDQIVKDLIRAEMVTLPLAALVLVLVFGSVVAALLPLVIGLFSIVSTLAILRAFTLVTDVSVFALNTATALGLAVAIDYSLFIVSRYREELAAGADYESAALIAVQTAGRTIWFSTVAVGIGMAALFVYPMYFLRSVAYTGIAVVACAAAASIVITPALLVALGPRIDRYNVASAFRRISKSQPGQPESTIWYRTATAAMRRPMSVAVVITAALLLLGTPFISIQLGYPDDRVLHRGAAPSRDVGDLLRKDFAQNFDSVTYVVLPDFQGDDVQLSRYAADMSRVTDVSTVLSGGGIFVGGTQVFLAPPGYRNDAGAVVAVATSVDPFSDRAKTELSALRAIPPPGKVMFTGNAATNADFVAAIMAGLPAVALLVMLSTLCVLFVLTGSIVLPVKALVMNMLSLTAAFGAMVWVFQEGHFAGLFGFTPTGYLNASIPILMFCVVFGMSMDYEVFLLSRIREEWLSSDRTGASNTRAVAMGIVRTGRIFTAAAVLMAIILGGLVTAKVTFIQMFGLGLALTAIVDATVVRLLLVPAFMRMLGRFNWWAPGPMRSLHEWMTRPAPNRKGDREMDPATGTMP